MAHYGLLLPVISPTTTHSYYYAVVDASHFTDLQITGLKISKKSCNKCLILLIWITLLMLKNFETKVFNYFVRQFENLP